jgi:hypothetical protein
MDVVKLGKAQRARELARWFREEMRCGVAGEVRDLMASTAVALEWEAFRLEREGGARRNSRRPRLIYERAA